MAQTVSFATEASSSSALLRQLSNQGTIARLGAQRSIRRPRLLSLDLTKKHLFGIIYLN